jgi:hypothetical protein
MEVWQERYWLVRHASRGPETDERRAEDFVCCEVPVGGDAVMALEVFTARELAEAERLGMERLAQGGCSRAPRKVTLEEARTKRPPRRWSSWSRTGSPRCSKIPVLRTYS